MNIHQFNTDCEGPISKNDNALELTSYFLPQGDDFFAKVSKYDDYLADIIKKPGYKAGDTLRLIIPFLKAYGATNREVKNYSSENILLMPGAKKTLDHIASRMPAFIVSTSYRPYIYALCDAIGFPKERVWCTELNLDKYNLTPPQTEKLKTLREEITDMPQIKLPSGAVSFEDLPSDSKVTIKRLDEIFWQEIPSMGCGDMISEVNPVGGQEKAEALKESLSQTGGSLEDMMYVGDSITDVQAFELVRRGGGVTIAFNANRYALKSAEIACISPDAFVLALLAEVFSRGGRKALRQAATDWKSWKLSKEIYQITPLPKVCIIKGRKIEKLIKESQSLREAIRGEKIGKLG